MSLQARYGAVSFGAVEHSGQGALPGTRRARVPLAHRGYSNAWSQRDAFAVR